MKNNFINKLNRSIFNQLFYKYQQKKFEFVETQSGEQPIKLQNQNHYKKPLEQYKVKVEKFDKNKKNIEIQKEKPIPVSPYIGPISVENPKQAVKKYRWCSCGQSLKQPFCDNRHKGTDFKPMRFIVEEDVQEIQLCGCKLTTNAPFCDQITCKGLKN